MAILGNSTTTTSFGDAQADYIRGGIFTAPASGTLGDVWTYMSVDSGSGVTWKCCLYAMSGVNPTTLLATSNQGALGAGSSPGWRRVTWGTAPSVVSGTSYALVLHTGSSTLNIGRSTTGGTGILAADTYSNGALNPFNATHDHNTYLYRIYASIVAANTAPNAPTLVYPIGGEDIEPASGQTFTWTFSDDDTGDTQGAYQIAYKTSAASSYTELSEVTSAAGQHTFAAATFTNGVTYSWKVRTKDQLGELGPYCTAETFDAVTTPGLPTVATPAVNESITTASYSVTWVVTTQYSYQVRRVADDGAGAPDTATVYEDSGEQVSSSLRSHLVTFTVNARDEHVQVRIKATVGGAFSSWASVKVTTAFTPPTTPTIVVTADSTNGLITVVATEGDDPVVSYEDIYLSIESDGTDAIRVAHLNVPETTYTYYAPRAGEDYYFLVRAFSTGGSSADSAWTG